MSKTFFLPGNASIDGTPILVPTTLEAAGDHIQAHAAHIVGELERLKHRILALHETWTGAAADDYQILQQEWDLGAQGLFGGNGAPGVLGEIAQAMRMNWANYTDAELSNAQTWRH